MRAIFLRRPAVLRRRPDSSARCNDESTLWKAIGGKITRYAGPRLSTGGNGPVGDCAYGNDLGYRFGGTSLGSADGKVSAQERTVIEDHAAAFGPRRKA